MALLEQEHLHFLRCGPSGLTIGAATQAFPRGFEELGSQKTIDALATRTCTSNGKRLMRPAHNVLKSGNKRIRCQLTEQ